jgi:hypothetical protein
MGRTEIKSKQIRNAVGVNREDLDVTTASLAVIAKLIAGTGINISSTGVDIGTGDVTVSLVSSPTFVNLTLAATAPYLKLTETGGGNYWTLTHNAGSGSLVFGNSAVGDVITFSGLGNITATGLSLTGMLGIGVAPTSQLHVGSFTANVNSKISFLGTLISNKTDALYGIQNQQAFNPTGVSLSSIYGFLNLPTLTTSAISVGAVYAGFSRIDLGATYSGTIASAIAMYCGNPTVAGGAIISNYGVYIPDLSSGGTNNIAIYSAVSSGTGKWNIYASGTANNYIAGNLGLGQITFGTSATKILAIGSGTAPSTSPADAFQMYSADQAAGNACAHLRTEGGAIVKLYQQTHIADATDAATAITRINAILVALENNGLLATS